MKFKFGNKVVVTSKSFYEGATGIVVYYNSQENSYRLQLEYGIVREFFEGELKKSRKK